MQITYISGDLLQSNAYALVNAVNCQGVMGKGLAVQFKRVFPQNFIAYKEACRTKQCQIGRVFCFEEKGKYIINFPTKDKWCEPSQIEYIQTGLDSLVCELYARRDITSIAIPPLGCGLGGLNWGEINTLVVNTLSKHFSDRDLDVQMYMPQKPKPVSKHLRKKVSVNTK